MTEALLKTRLLYNTAHRIEADCRSLDEFARNSSDPVIQGYHACNMAVSTKYMLNPFKRLPIFNKGKELLEELISENFDNTELRYIRYTMQRNAPQFLGYYQNLETDRKLLAEYIRNHPDSDLTQHMMIYILDTNDPLKEDIGLKN